MATAKLIHRTYTISTIVITYFKQFDKQCVVDLCTCYESDTLFKLMNDDKCANWCKNVFYSLIQFAAVVQRDAWLLA